MCSANSTDVPIAALYGREAIKLASETVMELLISLFCFKNFQMWKVKYS